MNDYGSIEWLGNGVNHVAVKETHRGRPLVYHLPTKWKYGDAPVFRCFARKQRMLLINHASQSSHRHPGCLAPCHLPWHRAPQDFLGGLRLRRFSQEAGDDPDCDQNPLQADPEAWQTARPRLRRSLLCHWAIRSLGMTAVAVSKLLGISRSAATRAAYRGEAITAANNLTLVEGYNA